MKKLLTALFIATSLFASSSSVAQVLNLPNMVDCGPPDVVLEIIRKYEEQPIATAESFVMHPDGTMYPGTMYFFGNIQERTYSIVVSIEIAEQEFLWCIVNAGGEFTSMSSSKSTL